jgi:hypothetical protein
MTQALLQVDGLAVTFPTPDRTISWDTTPSLWDVRKSGLSVSPAQASQRGPVPSLASCVRPACVQES